MIDKRALSSPLPILCIYYRLVFTFLFKKSRAHLSKKTDSTKKRVCSCNIQNMITSLIKCFLLRNKMAVSCKIIFFQGKRGIVWTKCLRELLCLNPHVILQQSIYDPDHVIKSQLPLLVNFLLEETKWQLKAKLGVFAEGEGGGNKCSRASLH